MISGMSTNMVYGGPMSHSFQQPLQQPLITGSINSYVNVTSNANMNANMNRPLTGALNGQMNSGMNGQMNGLMNRPTNGMNNYPINGTMNSPLNGTMNTPVFGSINNPSSNNNTRPGGSYGNFLNGMMSGGMLGGSQLNRSTGGSGTSVNTQPPMVGTFNNAMSGTANNPINLTNNSPTGVGGTMTFPLTNNSSPLVAGNGNGISASTTLSQNEQALYSNMRTQLAANMRRPMGIGRGMTNGIMSNNVAMNNDSLNNGALNGATLNNGTLNNGPINSGTMNTGSLNNGTLNNGTLTNGTMNTGTMNNGTMNTGTMNTGSVSNGLDIPLILPPESDSSRSLLSILNSASSANVGTSGINFDTSDTNSNNNNNTQIAGQNSLFSSLQNLTNAAENSNNNSSTVPPVSTSNSPGIAEKKRLIQKQLILLLHAHKCMRREQNNMDTYKCELPNCRTMRSVLSHLTVCQAGKSCAVAHCASSRSIIAHWRYCSNEICAVCAPVRQVNTEQLQPTHQELHSFANQKRKLDDPSVPTNGVAKQVKVSSNCTSDDTSDDKLCVICLQSLYNTVLVPCGHLYFCFDCATTIKGKNGECPICRSYIGSVLRVYTPS